MNTSTKTRKKFTAVRLDPDIRRAAMRVSKASRRSISEILRECIHAHLPVLRERYMPVPAPAPIVSTQPEATQTEGAA